MKNLLYILVVSSFLITFFSCSGGKAVKLSDLDSKFSSYENKEGFDGIKKSVTYSVTGKPNYDTVFKESANMAAILKQINFALDKMNKNPEETLKKLNAALLRLKIDPTKVKSIDGLFKEIDKKASPADKEDLFPIYILSFAVKKLPDLLKSAKKIKDNVKKLKPKDDFKGADALKIPGAVSGIASTLTNVGGALTGIPKTLKNTKQLTSKIISYLKTGKVDNSTNVASNETIETTETTDGTEGSENSQTETTGNNNKTNKNTSNSYIENKELNVIMLVSSTSDMNKLSLEVFKSGIETYLTKKQYVIIPSEFNAVQCNDDTKCYIKLAQLSNVDGVILLEATKLQNKHLLKLTHLSVSKNGIIKNITKIYEDDINNHVKLLAFAQNFESDVINTNTTVETEIKKETNIVKCTDNCKLEISSEVDSKIYINNIYKSNQQVLTTLKAGTYKIKVTKEGFDDYEEEIILDKDINKTIVLQRNIFNFKVSSNVEADVYINDEIKGKTPFETTLKNGIYKLTLKKEGYDDFEFKGKVEKDIDREFKLIQNSFDMKITSNVEADIYINGELKGKSPLNLTLKKGDYSIVLKKDGYETYKSSFSITDKNEYSNINLLKLFNLNLTSNIEADIYINGELQINKTPFSLKLEAGTYKIKAAKEGYDSFEEEIIIENEDFSQDITLKNYNFGIKAGVGTSSFNSFDGLSYGLNVGGLFKYNINSFKLQTELLFTGKNTTYKSPVLDTVDISQYAIEIPLIAGINIKNASIYIGVYLSETFSVIMNKGTNPISSIISTFGFSIGVDYTISNFLIDLRFSQDYSSIIDIDGKNLLNELFSFNFGYLF